MKRATSLVAAALSLALVFSAPARAADFAGQTVQWIIPFAEGGGTDRWARFYAPLLSENLPGQPEVVVVNQSAGASIIGANRFARTAKPDGLAILGTSATTQFPFLLGDKRVEYDYDEWTVVLGSPAGGVVYASPSLEISALSDLKKLADTPLDYAGQGATGIDIVPLLAMDLLGLDVRPLFGARGRSEAREKFEAGETQIDFQTTPAYLKNVRPMAEAGKATPLFAFGILNDNGELVRDPTFPDLPHFGEAYAAVHGEAPSGRDFEAWKILLAAGFAAQKMAFLPKGAPREIANVYRHAFRKAVESEEFAKNGRALLGAYPQALGNDADKLKKIATQISPRQRERITSWLINDAFPRWSDVEE